jgi:hypothetical protein
MVRLFLVSHIRRIPLLIGGIRDCAESGRPTVLLDRYSFSPRGWSGAPSGLQADLSWTSDEFELETRGESR